MPKRNILLTVIPKPESIKRAVFKLNNADTILFKGDGDFNYLCGKCCAILVENVNSEQIDNVVLICNRCGSYNDVLKSLIIEALSLPAITIHDLYLLKSLSEKALRGETSPKKFEKEAVEITDKAGLTTKIFTRENFRDFMLLLTVLIGAIGAVIAAKALQLQAIPSKENKKEAQAPQKVEVTVKLTSEKSIPLPPSLNALCPCGSGKKFKRCHGKDR